MGLLAPRVVHVVVSAEAEAGEKGAEQVRRAEVVAERHLPRGEGAADVGPGRDGQGAAAVVVDAVVVAVEEVVVVASVVRVGLATCLF